MKPYDSTTLATLGDERGLIRRDFVYVRGKTNAGDAVNFGFWNGEDDVSITVVSAVDRVSESRAYIGGGSLLDIDSIPLTIGIDVGGSTFSVTLSQIHTDVQTMVRGNDIRHAIAEVHRGLFSISTGQLVATPYPRFLGKIDGAPIATPQVGQEGSISLRLVPNSVELTRINPALKSDAAQSRRSGDRFRRYADSTGETDVWWGQARGTS